MPPNEAQRAVAVRSYSIMDTGPEPAFDELGQLAAQICGCPVSYVSFIEDDRLWLKAKYGLPADFEGCPREISFCSVTVCGPDLVVAEDLVEDDRFRDFHYVVNEPHFRFYCAMPLITPDGYALGTICVMDFRPRQLSFEQMETMRRLAHQLVGHLEHRRRLIDLDRAMRERDAAHESLAAEKQRTEALLHRILPPRIAEELLTTGRVEPRFHASATVLLVDVKGFTGFTERAEPAALIGLLDRYFAAFDEIVARHALEKIKTIGDAYLAVAGVPESPRLHALDACLAALELRAAVDALRRERERLRLPFFDVRIGVGAGPVIAGVVGRTRFSFDVWGVAVNIAAAMEAHGEAGRINLCADVADRVRPWVEVEDRGPVEVKDGRSLPMSFLVRLKPAFAVDPEGQRPSAALTAAAAAGRMPSFDLRT